MGDHQSLTTQDLRELRRVFAQSEAQPTPQQVLDAGQKQPHNATCAPNSSSAQHDDSMSASANEFTFNTENRILASSARQYDLSALNCKSSPVQPLIPLEHVQSLSMHHSTLGFAYDGAGDTQPMDTQIFREYSDIGTSRVVSDGLKRSMILPQHSIIEDGEPLGQSREKVDLTDDEDFDDVSSLNRTDEVSPFAPATARDVATFKQPLPPRTPLNAGTKRKRPHETSTPDTRTCSTKGKGTVLRNLLGGHAVMPNLGNMSQLFMNTQVESSPAPAVPHSDSPFNKPSPTLFIAQHIAREYSASSPVRPSTSDGVANGPFNRYRRMDESQESRARREQQDMWDLQRTEALDEEDLLFDSIPSQARRDFSEKQRKAYISHVDLSTSKPLRSSPRISRSKSVDHLSSEQFSRTPAPKALRPQSVLLGLTSDMLDAPDLPDTVQKDKTASKVTVGIQVPMTSSKPQKRSQPALSPSSSQRSRYEHGNTQLTVAVHDSQGDTHDIEFQHDAMGRLLRSSALSAHRVQQSQYSDLTGETRAQIDAGVLQAQDEDMNDIGPVGTQEDVIPSSPPIEFSEHDHEYDGQSDMEVLGGESEMLDTFIEEEDQDMPDAEDEREAPCDVQTDGEHNSSRSAQKSQREKVANFMAQPVVHDALDERSSTADPHAEEIAYTLITGLRSTSPAENPADQIAFVQDRATVTSASTELFDTAATHQTPSSSRVQQIMHSERQSQVSPIKRLQDIAEAQSPRRSGASLESQQLNAVMDDIFSDTDRAYLDITGRNSYSPRRKRLRTYKDRPSALREPSTNVNLKKTRQSGKVVFAADTEISNNAQESSTTSTTHATSTGEHGAAAQDASKPVHKRKVRGARTALAARCSVASRNAPPLEPEKQGHREAFGTANGLDSTAKEIADDLIETEKEDPSIPSPPTSSPIQEDLTTAATTSISPLASHSVLALFKGNQAYWYPGTYLETLISDRHKCKVRFYDGTVVTVEVAQTRTLALRENDCVKVDLSGMRKGTYLIQDFSTCSESTYTDALGHAALKLVPRSAEGVAGTQEPVIVPVERIYVTGNMLPSFADRRFVPPVKEPGRLSTPALGGTSEPTTPGSRSRRQHLGATINNTLHKAEVSSALFSEMTFATTFGTAERLKDTVAKNIVSNGGLILESGFEELFDSGATHPSSPTKSPERSTSSTSDKEKNLRLRSSAHDLGFCAVIADRHYRSPKYLQALALGVPCLHHRWVTDCIAQSSVLPFDSYLLPAGESEYLDGAVRSRSLAPFHPTDEAADLAKVVARRTLIFNGLSILLIIGNAEARKTYRFLAHAAGATVVQAVANLNEAKNTVKDGLKANYILSDGDPSKVQEALFGPKKQEAGKKRKRDSVGLCDEGRGDVKVGDKEFLLQSLILGALAEI